MKNTVKCHECKERVSKDIVIRYDTSTEKRKSHANLHPECVQVFEEKREERRKLDELYQYVRKEIYRQPDNIKLSPHMMNRFLGVRSGEYGAKRNKKVSLSEEGYPYEVVLLTFKAKKMDIIRAIDSTNFENERHRDDYVMTIILNNINDIYNRLKEKERVDNKLESLDFSKFKTENNREFIDRTNIKENKVANLLDELW